MGYSDSSAFEQHMTRDPNAHHGRGQYYYYYVDVFKWRANNRRKTHVAANEAVILVRYTGISIYAHTFVYSSRM